MKRETFKVKVGNGLSPSKIENIYKKLGCVTEAPKRDGGEFEVSLWKETVEELNEFLLQKRGFWMEMVHPAPNDIYEVEFTKTPGGLLYCIKNEEELLSNLYQNALKNKENGN